MNREAYYFDSLGVEKTLDDVMILGLGDKTLAKKILNTNYKYKTASYKIRYVAIYCRQACMGQRGHTAFL